MAVEARSLKLEPKRLTLILKTNGWSDSSASQLKQVVCLPAIEWKRFEEKNLTFRAALLEARKAKKAGKGSKIQRLHRSLESVFNLLESNGRDEFHETYDGYEVIIKRIAPKD